MSNLERNDRNTGALADPKSALYVAFRGEFTVPRERLLASKRRLSTPYKALF